MKTLFAISATLLLASLFGCGGGAGGFGAPAGRPPSIKVEFIGGQFGCDPDGTFPQEVGTLRVSHVGADGSGDITVSLGDFTNQSVKPEPGPTTLALVPGDVWDTKLYAWDCDWDVVNAFLTTESVYERTSLTLVLNNAFGPLRNLFTLTKLLIPHEDPAPFFGDSVNLALIGALVPWSSPAINPLVPSWFWTEINRFGVMRRNMLLALILRAFGAAGSFKTGGGSAALDAPLFPVGAGPNGYTVAPSMPASMDEGEYFFAYLSTEEDIPTSSSRFITYGFVFDADGDPTNNYVPHPSFPDDYFKDTDRWYTLDYDPSMGWTLICRSAVNSVVREVPTAARAVIRGNSILLVVPSSEFAAAEPSYRVTAFTHTGDYGANAPHDWSGDQHPNVFEGLAPFVRQP